MTTDSDGPRKRVNLNGDFANRNASYAIRYCRRLLPPDIAPGLLLRLPGMIRRADVVHLNSVYSFTTIPVLALCRLMKKPLAWSTMGALQRWEGTTHRGLKAVWDRLCNALCEPHQVVLHVTSEEEKIESLEKIPAASAMVLRNGIEIPELIERGKDRNTTLRLLYLGRLHPIKGIENLVHALTLVKSNVRLAICGAGDADYETRLRALVKETGLTDVVEFHGRVDGELKERHFHEADLCVAPSFKEAFCTVVIESLARALPVIASHGIPWQRIEEIGCGLWVSNEPAKLADAIDRAAAMPLAEMGLRGREWMAREFSWTQVGEEMVEKYKLLIGQKPERQSLTKSQPA